MTSPVFQHLREHPGQYEATVHRFDDLPTAEEIAILAQQRYNLKIYIAEPFDASRNGSRDTQARLLDALKEQLTVLLPGDRAVRTWVHIRGSGPEWRVGDDISSRWSAIAFYRAWTEGQISSIAPLVAAAARDYDTLATDLMVRLAAQLGDPPDPFAECGSHWCDYPQKGRLGDWGYFFHGLHCCFGTKAAWRLVEATQGGINEAGYGFGLLDADFFPNYCRQTPQHTQVLVAKAALYKDWDDIYEVSAKYEYLQKVTLYRGGHTGYVARPL